MILKGDKVPSAPMAKSTFQEAAQKYLDPATPPEEKAQLRHKLDPFIRIEKGQEIIDLPD